MLFILWVWTNVTIYNDIYPSLYLKSILTSSQFLCALPVHFSAPHAAPLVYPKSPPNNLIIVSIVLPLPEYHIVGIIQCTVFSDWFLLFSNMHLIFLYVFPGSSDSKESACNVGDLGFYWISVEIQFFSSKSELVFPNPHFPLVYDVTTNECQVFIYREIFLNAI